MKLSMRTILTCFQDDEPFLSLPVMIERLAKILDHEPRPKRLANFLHDVPSKVDIVAPDGIIRHERVYQRWDIKEAADVEQADEERAAEKAPKPVKVENVTVMLRAPAALIARLQPQAEAQGMRLNDLIVSFLERGLAS